MCRKTIYHNTYVDGDRDITERVDCCTPGRMCANPKIREVHRQQPYTKAGLSSSPGRASPAIYDRDMYPPTPLSNSPSPRPDGERSSSKYHNKRGQDIYVGGTRVVEVNDHSSGRRRRADRRPVVLEPASTSQGYKPYAPEPPSPRPIPIKRSSTMTYGIDTPPREETRGRRPIIVEERVSSSSRRPSVGASAPVDILEHASAPRLHRRASTRRDSAFLAPRAERSPQGYASAEDERERHERRRIRHERRAQAAAMASSAPTSHQDVPYASSYGSSYPSSPSSSNFASSPKFAEPSAAVHEVKKHLRWEDQMRARQNAKIDSRPKLSRPNTAGGGVQTEVKSILKNAGEGQQQQPARDGMAELYSSMEGLGIRGASSSRPSSRDKKAAAQTQEDREEAEYQERLRNRFSMPPRRYTSIGPKRRSEVWYPDEGRYKYL